MGQVSQASSPSSWELLLKWSQALLCSFLAQWWQQQHHPDIPAPSSAAARLWTSPLFSLSHLCCSPCKGESAPHHSSLTANCTGLPSQLHCWGWREVDWLRPARTRCSTAGGWGGSSKPHHPHEVAGAFPAGPFPACCSCHYVTARDWLQQHLGGGGGAEPHAVTDKWTFFSTTHYL